MGDLALSHELILIVSIIAVIAWFMGRTVCTSKDHQLRSSLKVLQRENKRLDDLLAEKDKEIHEVYDQLKTERKKYIEVEQKYDIADAELANLNKQHEITLKELQSLKACQLKFETLSQHYDDQSVECINLKNTIDQLNQKMQENGSLIKNQKHELEKYKLENKQLTVDVDEQIKDIEKLKVSLAQRDQDLQDKVSLCDKWEDELTQCKLENDELKKEVQAYKILSTIR